MMLMVIIIYQKIAQTFCRLAKCTLVIPRVISSVSTYVARSLVRCSELLDCPCCSSTQCRDVRADGAHGHHQVRNHLVLIHRNNRFHCRKEFIN